MTTLIESAKKNKKTVLLSLLIFMIFTISMIVSYHHDWKRAIESAWNVVTVDNPKLFYKGDIAPLPLQDGQTVTQDISMASEKITGFSLKLADVDEKTEGSIKVTLTDNQKRMLQEWDLNLNEFARSGFCDFYLNTEHSTKVGEWYHLSVTSYDIGDETPSLVLTGPSELASSVRIEGGEELPYCLSFRLLNGGNGSLRYLFTFFYLCAAGTILIVGIMLLKKRTLQSIFVVMATLIGSIYLFAVPPFAVPDEASHFATAYVESSMLLGRETLDENGMIIMDPNVSLYITREEAPTRDSLTRYIKGAFGKTDSVLDHSTAFRRPLSMQHPGYAPQVLGLTLGRLLNMGGEQLLLLGRLFSLLWYSFLMYWAIKKIPFGKMFLFCIGMLPMTLQMVVSFNYDSVLFGASFFCFAYLLYLAYDKEKEQIQWKDMLLIILPTIAIASIKTIYLLILGLGLLIPKEKFRSMKNKWFAGAGLVGVGLVTVGLTRLTAVVNTLGTTAPASAATADTMVKFSLSYCIQHPLEIIIMIWTTLEKYASAYVNSMIATPLGWLEMPLPEIIVILFVILLLLSLLQTEDAERQIKMTARCYTGVLAALSILAVIGYMLIDHTYIGSALVEGVQGRYFLPILPMLFILLQNRTIVLKSNIDRYIILGIGYVQLLTILNVTAIIVNR